MGKALLTFRRFYSRILTGANGGEKRGHKTLRSLRERSIAGGFAAKEITAF